VLLLFLLCRRLKRPVRSEDEHAKEAPKETKRKYPIAEAPPNQCQLVGSLLLLLLPLLALRCGRSPLRRVRASRLVM
jgi:hypothetical protein